MVSVLGMAIMAWRIYFVYFVFGYLDPSDNTTNDESEFLYREFQKWRGPSTPYLFTHLALWELLLTL